MISESDLSLRIDKVTKNWSQNYFISDSSRGFRRPSDEDVPGERCDEARIDPVAYKAIGKAAPASWRYFRLARR